MAPVFLFILVIIAWARWRHPGYFTRLLNAFVNSRILRQVMREESVDTRQNFLFTLVFCLVMGLFLFATAKVFLINIWGLTGFLLFLLLTALPAVVYTIKSFFIRTVKVISDGDFSLDQYLCNVFLINRMVALVLLPCVLILCYTNLENVYLSIWIYWAILGSFWLYRLFRGTMGALESKVPLFYIFFYICNFEILPAIICLRFIIP